MIQFIAKTTIIALIPKLINELSDFIFGNNDEKQVQNKRKTTPSKTHTACRTRKKRDTAKLHQGQYDLILACFDYYKLINNITNRKIYTQDDITAVINDLLNLDKSKFVYQRIWNNHTKKEDLITGQPVLIWSTTGIKEAYEKLR
jgi:hypothetical protein